MQSEDLKNPSVDTPGENPAETGEGQGTVDDNKVDTTQVTPKVETEPNIEMVPKTELDKIEKRKNQLENQLRDALKTADSTEKDEIIADLQSRLDAIDAEKEEEARQAKLAEYGKNLDGVFEKTLEGYPDAVKKAASFNKKTLGIWGIVGDHQYSYEAEANIKNYLDGLAKEIGEESKPEIKVEANNLPVGETPSGVEINASGGEMTDTETNYLASVADESFDKIGIKRQK